MTPLFQVMLINLVASACCVVVGATGSTGSRDGSRVKSSVRPQLLRTETDPFNSQNFSQLSRIVSSNRSSDSTQSDSNIWTVYHERRETRLLPTLNIFTEKASMYKDRHWNQYNKSRLPSKLAIALGIFSCIGEQQYHNIIRQTWVRQPDVCTWYGSNHFLNTHGEKEKGPCVVNAVFVEGEEKGPHDPAYMAPASILFNLKHRWEPNVVHFPIEDGYQCYVNGTNRRVWSSYRAKVIRWLHFAAQFKWATHIAIQDQDFLPNYHVSLPYVAAFKDKYQFIGFETCPHSLDAVRDDFVKGVVPTDPKQHKKYIESHAFCLLGGITQFYSRQLAEDITANSTGYRQLDLFSNWWPGILCDQYSGYIITDFVSRTGSHVATSLGAKFKMFAPLVDFS